MVSILKEFQFIVITSSLSQIPFAVEMQR